MKRFWLIYQRELSHSLHSFTAYVLLAVFIAITGYFFASLVASFSILSQQWKAASAGQAMTFNLTEMVLTTLFLNSAVMILFFTPILTMRAFAEEKRQGTLELLLTLPVRDHEILLGKFAAALTLFIYMILPMAFFPILVRCVGGYFEWGTVWSGFLGLFLLGGSFIAVGLFASSLTENQVISALVSFGILLILWVMGWLEMFSEIPAARIAGHLSSMEHFKSLARGVVDLKDIAYYLFFIFFFLYASLLTLESRALKR